MKVFRFLLILLILITACAVYFMFTYDSLGPVDKDDTSTVEYVISDGDDLSSVIVELNEQGLLKSVNSSIDYATENNIILYPGTFTLSPSYTTQEVFQSLENPNTGESFVIVEGAKLEDIVTNISDVTDYTYDEIFAYINDTSNLNVLIDQYWFLTDEILQDGIRYPLEGYFTPATYSVSDSQSIEDIVTNILNNTDIVLSQYQSEFEQNEYSVHELLSLASVVERETITTEDKELVAGVFYNRLNSDYQYLESDITVLYGQNTHKERVTYDDLEYDSPYNTYLYPGIPIGPIASPSVESIQAVLYPKESDYLYFFATQDGEVIYSETYDEHLKASEENAWDFS